MGTPLRAINSRIPLANVLGQLTQWFHNIAKVSFDLFRTKVGMIFHIDAAKKTPC